MGEPNFTLRVVVEPGRCWGRVVGEDSDQGACQLCVETCPEVFEKPLANRCAQVRPGIDSAQYVARTENIRLGTSILLVNLRNPLLVAKMLSTADYLSGGRVVVGASLGGRIQFCRRADEDPG